jgi:epoxyqueuosine reductase
MRTRRRRPIRATLLAGARSVVCIAMPFATPPPAERRGRGRVSAYAWSRDYHQRMQPLLRAIAARIDALAGEPATRVACDTAPLAERAFAARSGLAWIGKHTSAIVPGLGSAVFLGRDRHHARPRTGPPVKRSCGACTRCIDVCPTGALRGDGTIDATRCISDLTQRRDAIPRALRPLIGTWVWGCDLCNDACPPSQRAGARGDETARPLDDESAAPTLTPCCSCAVRASGAGDGPRWAGAGRSCCGATPPSRWGTALTAPTCPPWRRH